MNNSFTANFMNPMNVRQQPIAMQQPMGMQQDNTWFKLGENLGGLIQGGLNKQNDGLYKGAIVGGTGNDAQNYNDMQNVMQGLTDNGIFGNSVNGADPSSFGSSSISDLANLARAGGVGGDNILDLTSFIG